MSTQKIAQFMIERRGRSMPVVTTGDVLSNIGSEGLQEALTRRWLVPSHDTGLLQINTDLARVTEMQEAAGTPDAVAQVAESVSAPFVLEHAGRTPIFEISAPGTGRPGPTLARATPTTPPPPAAPPAPAAPAAPAAPSPAAGPSSNGQAGEYGIGSNVTVAEDGRSYTGKIAARTPEGRYRLSFGAGSKPPVSREYSPNEMQTA